MLIYISKSGIGTIIFGQVSLNNRFYSNTGIESPRNFLGGEIHIFYDIQDAKKVYELVRNLSNVGGS